MSEIDENRGAGSGGGAAAATPPGATTAVDDSFDGSYAITANQLFLMGRPALPPAIPSTVSVGVLATGLVPIGDGFVNIRGTAGVRITAGPPELPPMASSSTNGVEIIVSELQNVTIQRGLIPGVDQKIEMTPSGITVDGGAMPVTIQSLTEVTISVAGGMSTITLSPAGVQIQGVPLVQIQGGPLVMIN